MQDEILTLEELCKLLKVSRSTIDRWRKEGMPHFKAGRGVRFFKNEVFKWIKENKQEN